MAGYRLIIRSAPSEVIRHLPPSVKRPVRSAIRLLAADPSIGEKLHGELEGFWKYRVNRYRLVYRVRARNRIIELMAIGHRRSIYEEVAELLKSEAKKG